MVKCVHYLTVCDPVDKFRLSRVFPFPAIPLYARACTLRDAGAPGSACCPGVFVTFEKML